MTTLTSHSTQQTQAFAETLGKMLRGGEIIELVSDVGGGKTTFVKGLAPGLGINDVVQSPTFTISRIYNARDGLELHHFDFYRLREAGIVAAELAESLTQPNAVVIIEWGDIVHTVLPHDRLTVNIESFGDTGRQLTFRVSKNYDYLLETINSLKKEYRA